MKKLRIVEQNFLTLEEGCNKYLDNCRSRNLREGTINHYRQSYVFESIINFFTCIRLFTIITSIRLTCIDVI